MFKILSVFVFTIWTPIIIIAVPMELLNVLPAVYEEIGELHNNANDQANNLDYTPMQTIFNTTNSSNILNDLVLITENEQNDFHNESYNLHQIYLKGLKDNPNLKLNNSLIKLSEKLLAKTNDAINKISIIFNQESNQFNKLFNVLKQSFGKVNVTNGYISMPKEIQQEYITTIDNILKSINLTGKSIENFKGDIKSVQIDLQPALKTTAIPTMNFMFDAVFSSIFGVLNELINSYNIIEINVQNIGNSFTDLTNIVKNGKNGPIILIPKREFDQALGKAIDGVIQAYYNIGNNELELESQIAYLDEFVQKVFEEE